MQTDRQNNDQKQMFSYPKMTENVISLAKKKKKKKKERKEKKMDCLMMHVQLVHQVVTIFHYYTIC